MRMRTILLFALPVLLSAGVFSLAADRRWPHSDPEVYGIGRLVRNVPLGLANPSEYMLEDGFLYRGAVWRINGINVVWQGRGTPEAHAGKLVTFSGVRRTDLTAILKKIGKAPADYGQRESMVQLRSDWMAPETGFSVGRSTRARLQKTEYLIVNEIKPFTGLEVRVGKGTVEVLFRNTLGSPVKELVLTAQYEGVMGKPGTWQDSRRLPELVPDGTARVRFAVTALKKEGAGQGEYRYSKVLVSFRSGNFPYNFDY